MAFDIFSLVCVLSKNSLFSFTSGLLIVSIVASVANSCANASANASFLVPLVDVPTSLPKKYFINSALAISFFLNIFLPSLVFSLLPVSSANGLNLLLITS